MGAIPINSTGSWVSHLRTGSRQRRDNSHQLHRT